MWSFLCRVSETATLEKDAIEMEMRLKMLQEKMAQQQQQEASKMGNSGTLWKSSRPDKGSVRSYGKDVQEKHRRKMETLEHGGMLGVNSIGNSNDGSMKGTAAARRNSRQASAGDFHSKGITFNLFITRLIK